jgi:VWFA-related protein
MKIEAFLALLLSFCILLPVLAQTKPAAPVAPPQKPSDDDDEVVKITTNLVQVDAVVTKDGKMVTNLTADDFEIYEDGRKQAITSFAYISNVPNTIASQPVARDKNNADVPFATRIDPNEPHRTIAFVVDDLGTSAESIGLVRHQLKKFIAEQLQPNDLIAIIRTGGELGVLQQFTNDKRLLNRAVERLRWNHCSRMGPTVFQPAGMDFNYQEGACGGYAYRSTGRALRFILDGMADLPGRKSMVLMSDDLPRETQEPNFTGDSVRDLLGSGSLGDRSLDSFGNTADWSGMLQRIAEKAIRSSVVIYSVDTAGLQYTGPTAADAFRGDARQITKSITDLTASRSRLLWTRREGGELIAKQTGGFQIRNSNGFRFNEIVEDQSGYYLLGYRPTDETFNRRFHKIKAKVKRSGMTLRTRFGFFGVSEDEVDQKRRIASDVTNLALASPFAAQDINVEISSVFASDKWNGSTVRSFVYLDGKDLTWTPTERGQQATFELHGVMFGDNGAVVGERTGGSALTLLPKDYEHALRYGLQFTLDIPVKRPGAYQVRIAARDRASKRLGSAGQFVAVPNLNDKKLALSGIVMGVGTDSARHQLYNSGARRFALNSDLFFGYMVYNATNESGAQRNLVMQAKIFRDGKNVYSGPVEPVKGVTNQVDLSRLFVIGSVRLAPDLELGSYYLQVTVREPGVRFAPVVQWVNFEVTKSREESPFQ